MYRSLRAKPPLPLLCHGPEATRDLGDRLLWPLGKAVPMPPQHQGSAPWGRAHCFAWKWALVFQEPLTGEGQPNHQAASSTTACRPHTLPPGQWWKVLNLYPETVSCITYRSELFIIPPGLQ